MTAVRPEKKVTQDAGERARAADEKMTGAEEALLTMPLMTVGGRTHSARVRIPRPQGLLQLKRGEHPLPGWRVMRVPTVEAGDERYTWDADDFDQIREAKRFFNDMVAKG